MQDERWQQAIIGLVTLDLEGKIVAVNQTFTDLVGYTATELCGNHIEKVMNNGSSFFFHSWAVSIFPDVCTPNVSYVSAIFWCT